MANRVMVAVVFTDLVDSTALAADVGPDRADELRRAHFALLREAIDEAGGREVKNLGDGLMAVFDGPSRSLACAVAMQRAVARHDVATPESLRIRIGLSVGEAVLEDGDYFGEPVVEAARLCSAAQGGQILTTRWVEAIAGRHSPHEFRSVGELDLKGIPEPVAAVEVGWEPVGGADQPPLPSPLAAVLRDGFFGFVGRGVPRAEIDGAWKQAVSEPQVRTVLVSGEAGIGKSSLIARVATDAHDDGAAVLFGHCDEDLAAPYQPWIEALAHLVEHLDDELVERLAPAHRRALMRLVPALGSGVPAPGDASDAERLTMIQAIEALLVLAAGAHPLVLVLDDLHWADAASLQVLRRLVASSPPAPLLVLGTYRHTDLGAGHPLTALLADLYRVAGVSRLSLDGLDDTDILEMMTSTAGHELDDAAVALAHSVRRETQGNPFFTGELLRHLGESGIVVQGDDGRWRMDADLGSVPLPASVRDVVGRRVARLGERCERLLSLASVIGREFGLDLLLEICDRAEDEVLDDLDAAVAAAVISEREGHPGVFRFGHALIQRTLYTELGDARRARTHHRIAEALERLPGRAVGGSAELARHWLEAVRPAEEQRAMDAVLRAADDALEALAPHDAIGWYERALELSARTGLGDDRLRARILVGLGAAQRQIGDVAHRQTLLDAVAIARTIGDVDLLVKAVLAADRGIAGTSGTDVEWVTATEAALEAVGTDDSRSRARLLTLLSQVIDADEWERRRDLIAEAEGVARRIDDRASLRIILPVAYQHHGPEALDRRLADTAEAIDLATEAGDAVARCNALFHRIDACLQAADLDEVDRRIDELDALASDLDLPLHRWQLHMCRAQQALLAGSCAEAEAEADTARDVGLEGGHTEALLAYGAQLVDIRRHQGRLGEVVDLFPDPTSDEAAAPGFRQLIAGVYAETGRLDGAAIAFEADKESGFAEIPLDESYLALMNCCATTAVELADREAAERLAELLKPYAGRVISAYATCGGAIDRLLGQLAHVAGRLDEAELHYHAALDVHERLRAPYLIARTQADLRDLLVARSAPGDLEAADRLGSQVAETAARHGYAGLAARVGAG